MALHYNKEEWENPEEFIPERFDPSSKYFLTPSGKKRNPYSFLPFGGGNRTCFGKIFAENSAKIMILSIFSKYDFEFKDPS
mmetsp:Transcript_297/g.325  ORF Transcript_297/g.325 Transcript_297/m.325 type:complete len:81 (+) Transcript_297:242-484(+)